VSNSGKRVRGTALVFRDNAVLLVRDRGKTAFSLPGGEHEKGEALLCTAVRELHEELGLRVWKAERIYRCDHEGSTRLHKVTLVETTDDPRIESRELDEFMWWDRTSDVPRFAHVDAILRLFDRGT
jgi:8-oxo-dGTP pyrophosphatase MutT (NUDIX family)